MQEVREVGNLDRGEGRTRTAALHGVTLRKKWPDGASVAIVQDDFGAYEVGCVFLAPSPLAVASDALGYVDALSAIGPGRVYDMYIHGSSRWPASGRRAGLRRQILRQVIEDLTELNVCRFRAFGNHAGNGFGPLLAGLALAHGDFGAMASAAYFLSDVFAGRVWKLCLQQKGRGEQ